MTDPEREAIHREREPNGISLAKAQARYQALAYAQDVGEERWALEQERLRDERTAQARGWLMLAFGVGL